MDNPSLKMSEKKHGNGQHREKKDLESNPGGVNDSLVSQKTIFPKDTYTKSGGGQTVQGALKKVQRCVVTKKRDVKIVGQLKS